MTALSVPSPGSWLKDAMRRHRFAQSTVARLLGVDESRFSRYVRGKEQLPRYHLAQLALELEPEAYEYVFCLKDCEDLADVLRRETVRFAAVVQDAITAPPQSKRAAHQPMDDAAARPLADYPSDALLGGTQAILAEEPSRSPFALARAWRRHFAAAARAVDLVRRPVEASFSVPPLPPETVPGFRFPVNHFVGILLDLDQFVPSVTSDAAAVLLFRRLILKAMRDAVWGRSRSAPPMDVLARQFTTHLLGRHGEADDRDGIRQFLEHKARTAEPLIRRLSFTGLVLRHRETDTADRFLWSLQRDRALASVNLLFNAFHYGDLSLPADQPLPGGTSRFDRSVPHILRHLEHPEEYRSILETECVTLTHVLGAGGPRLFRRPSVRSRLRAILRDDTTPLALIRPAVRHLLMRTFLPIVGDR